MNLQIRQSIAGAASGTLRKYLQHWTLWSEWALECGIHPGQLALADMADYVNEVASEARQDRSRAETSSVSGVIQSLNFVGRKAQVDSLMTVLNSPLVTGYLMGAAVPRPRREALPLPLAALVQWERWICSGSAPDHEILLLGCILLMAWAGLRFADAQRTCLSSSLLPDRYVLRRACWRTKVSRSGQPFVALAFGFSGRPPCWVWGHVYFDAIRSWHSRMVSTGGQNLVTYYLLPHLVYHDKRSNSSSNPHELQHSNDVSPASPTGTTDAQCSNVIGASPAMHFAQP